MRNCGMYFIYANGITTSATLKSPKDLHVSKKLFNYMLKKSCVNIQTRKW